MLTDHEREKCRQLAQALDAGDAAAYRRAEPSLTAAEKGAIWDLRQHVQRQQQVAAKVGVLGAPRRTPRVEAQSFDLDYWPPDIAAADDDPPDDQPVCSGCHGTGRDAAGGVCRICNGAGKVPADDDEDDDDEGREDN